MAPNAGQGELGNRLVFHTSLQKQNESEDAFAGRLKTLSLSCNFKGGKEVVESLIRDRFIAGLQDESKQNMLLKQNPSLTIKQALEVISETDVGSVLPHATRRSARQREGAEKSTIISILKSVKEPVIVLQRLPENFQSCINPDNITSSKPISSPKKVKQKGIPTNTFKAELKDSTKASVSATKPDLHISSESTRENSSDTMNVEEDPLADLFDEDQDEDYVLPVDDCVPFSSDSEVSPPASPLQRAVQSVFYDLATDIEVGEETQAKTTQFDEPEPVVVRPMNNHRSNPDPDQSEPSPSINEASKAQKPQPTAVMTDIPMNCAICCRTFDGNRTLLNHMRLSHNKEFNDKYDSIDRIPCRFCDETFLHVKILVLHIQNVHQDEAKERPPKCKQCRKVYPSEAILGWHLVRKHDTIPKNKGRVPEGKIIRCEDCTATFFHHHGFHKHLRMKHIDLFTNSPFKCDKCDDQFFIKKDLDAHQAKVCQGNSPRKAVKDKEPKMCDKCGETTTNLQNHIRIEHSGKSFKCQYCELSFPSLRTRLAHKIDKHPGAKISRGQRSALVDGEPVVENKIRAMTDRLVIDVDKLSRLDNPQLQEASFQCCNTKVYNELKDLHDHIYSKHRSSVGRNRKYFVLQEAAAAFEVTEAGYTLQKKIYGTALDYCSICNRHFKHEKSLRLHNAIYHKDLITEEDMIKCDFCESKFHGKHELKKHRKAEHPETYTHVCNLCDKVFQLERGLINHREQVHPSVDEKVPVKAINCEFCQESFNDTKMKLQHMEQFHDIRSDDNSVQCATCGNKFKHTLALTLHMSLKHGIKSTRIRGRAPEGVRFQCEHCEKSFKFIFDLRKHERVNHIDQITSNPLVCQECDAKFVKQSSLDTHMMKSHGMKREPRMKSETKMTLCPECGKSVTNLDSHIENAHSDKIFPCDHCPKKFGSIRNVRQHIVAVHHEKVKDGLYAKKKTLIYQCPHCAHTTHNKVQLSTHLTNVHGYEKPHECDICHQRFSTAGAARAHKLGN